MEVIPNAYPLGDNTRDSSLSGIESLVEQIQVNALNR